MISSTENPKKTVLLVGSGGREHAMAWKLSRSPQVGRLIVVPGNDGMPASWERWKMPIQTREDFSKLARRAREEKVDLTVIGPDNPLADGIVDVFEDHELRAFGPKAAAARIEASKAFAKEVMLSAGVPTAKHYEAKSFAEARTLIKELPWEGVDQKGWVIKVDGLALGKGVSVCATLSDGMAALKKLEALQASLGFTPHFVIEEKLSGEEISWLAFCDGTTCSLLEPARDFKRVGDRDQGPNTGGMGAFSPVPGLPPAFWERVRKEVFLPTLRDLSFRGTPFRGVLYAGLMVDFERDELKVLEFNARFGDPETQVLLARMDGDFYAWCDASARGELGSFPRVVPFLREAAVVVVGAAEGYPDSPKKGAAIDGPLQEGGEGPTPSYFSAGVAGADSDSWVVSGGRVFGAMGRGTTLEAARAEAYDRIDKIHFAGMHFRSDIAAEITENSAVKRGVS